MSNALKTSPEQDMQSLLRLLICGKLSTTEYTQRLANLPAPSSHSTSTHSVAPSLQVERILGLRGAVHHNPFQPGQDWNIQHQKTLWRTNPRLAHQLQAQALHREQVNHTSPPLPEYLPNPWLYGSQYSVAQQTHIQNASPNLAIQMQLECLRMGQDL